MIYRVIVKPRILANEGVKYYVQAKSDWLPIFIRVTGNFHSLSEAENYIKLITKEVIHDD